MYQPVMATTVVYMQKLLGRKAATQRGSKVSTACPTLHTTPAASLAEAGKTGTASQRGQHTKATCQSVSSFLRAKAVQGRQAKSLVKGSAILKNRRQQQKQAWKL